MKKIKIVKINDESYEIKSDPVTLFVSTMLRFNINSFRKHKKDYKEAEEFLFKGKRLGRFLEDYGFDNIRLDTLRHKILRGDKLSQFL